MWAASMQRPCSVRAVRRQRSAPLQPGERADGRAHERWWEHVFSQADYVAFLASSPLTTPPFLCYFGAFPQGKQS